VTHDALLDNKKKGDAALVLEGEEGEDSLIVQKGTLIRLLGGMTLLLKDVGKLYFMRGEDPHTKGGIYSKKNTKSFTRTADQTNHPQNGKP